jgi:hypothetical protein
MKQLLIAAVLGLVIGTIAYSQVPKKISYQGLLTTSGTPVPDGNYNLTFNLYTNSSGGTSLWTETHTGVPVSNGTFNVILGQITSLDGVSFAGQLYLGVAEGSNPEFSPRTPLTSAPYAMRADTAQYATSGGGGGGLTLPFAGTVSSSGTAFSITNTGTGEAMKAITSGTIALRAEAPGTGVAVFGLGTVIGSTGSGVNGIAGVRGEATNSSGQTYGVFGSNVSATSGAVGIRGEASASAGEIYGIYGTSGSSTSGSVGVKGEALTTSGVVHGVEGITNSTSTDASGVHGIAQASSGATNGVWGQTNSTTGGAVGVLGEANGASGVVHGVEGITASTTGLSSGVRGITIGGSGLIYGVSGLTNSPTDNAAGVYGEGHSTGITYGVHGVTTSSTNNTIDNTAGVKGVANAVTGRVYGVHGKSASSTGGTAGVRGDVPNTVPVGVNIPPTMGVWGFTQAQSRTEGVRGDAYFLGTPAFALDGTRIGVRGYAGPYATEITKRIGVEGDAHNAVTQPFTSSGARGFIRGSISALGYSGVVGQALPLNGEGPDPDASTVGHIGVWGISQSGILNSAGVVGDATISSASTTYGVWGRSKSTSADGAGVKAEGNGASGLGNPRAAALEINNGAVRVGGANRPAYTVVVDSIPEDEWVSISTCSYEDPVVGSHGHILAWQTDVVVNNSLIVDNSIILATIEAYVVATSYASHSVQVSSKGAGFCAFRVTAIGASVYPCGPPTSGVKIHYMVINPM